MFLEGFDVIPRHNNGYFESKYSDILEPYLP